MTSNVLFLFLVIITLSASLSYSAEVYIKWDEAQYNFMIFDHKISDAVAWANVDNAINKTGWGFLEVYTNGSYDDLVQAYAAGLAEGAVTRDLISMHWHNTYSGYCTKPLDKRCRKIQTFLDQNYAWMSEQIEAKADHDPYWHQVHLFMKQQAGLLAGYAGKPDYRSPFVVDVTSLIMLQIAGDLEDLTQALGISVGDRVMGAGSCSALIKVLPGNEDLYVAQDTWTGLNDMLRLLKKYDFHYSMMKGSVRIPGNVVTFSSGPGVLFSGDDFYIMNTGIVPIETTIGNGNPDLWKYVQPENCVFEVIRNIIANRLATTAWEWTDVFSRYNSGTYNNQWMVVDYKEFSPGHALPQSDLFVVLEQLPSMIVVRDLTQVLVKDGYFASYNTPYFPEIFNASGCWNNVKKYGDWFTYEHTPRANIFRRDQPKVKDTASMTKLMRYNDYTHDPLSQCNCTPPYSGENSISARSDLNPANGTYAFSALGHRSHAGIDMKLTTSALVKSLEFIAISSPAYDNVPPFRWSTSPFRDTVPHVGHPDLWTFKPVTHRWGSRTKV